MHVSSIHGRATRLPVVGLALLVLLLSGCVEINTQGTDQVDHSEGPGPDEVVQEKVPPIPYVYAVSTDQIEAFMQEGKTYLTRVQHPKHGGVYKYYYPVIDEFEKNLYTVYTSSFALALLNLATDGSVPEEARRATDFVMGMQNKEPGARFGAMHYMYSLADEEAEDRFVVGTSSKAIYTLIEMHKRTNEYEYLQSARDAGNWLLTMIQPQGNVKSYTRLNDDKKWVSGTSDSTLYNGQVLSALSRLYVHTQDERYLEGARKIAGYFLRKIDREGCYVGDDYRTPNPISSSWLMYSLIDFHKAQPDEAVRYVILDCSKDLITRQITDESDLRRHGRWTEAYSTSGVGWIAEVLVEIEKFCEEEKGENCQQYTDATVRAIRWLIQHTYSEAYAAHLAYPPNAIGGLFWGPSIEDRYVRTDSVSHGLNAYIGILSKVPKGTLLQLQH